MKPKGRTAPTVRHAAMFAVRHATPFTIMLAVAVALAMAPLNAARAADSPPDAQETWPRRVLITNDNGIEDRDKLLPLIRAFARIAETYVVVPSQDRSGSTHYMSLGSRQRTLEMTRVWETPKTTDRERIEAYALDGYPADCVAFGLLGLLRDNPPDLVVSGINGGPNLAQAWLGSGTIGAARVAAVAGIPAIAASGLDDDDPAAVAAATAWIVELARSPVVRGLEAGQYLTVSLPRRSPTEIHGVRVVTRAHSQGWPFFERLTDLTPLEEGRELWVMHPPATPAAAPEGSDLEAYAEGYISVVPMRADEHDRALFAALNESLAALPAWPPAAVADDNPQP